MAIWDFLLCVKTQTTKSSSPCRPRQVGFVSLNPNLYEKSAYKGRGVQGFDCTFLWNLTLNSKHFTFFNFRFEFRAKFKPNFWIATPFLWKRLAMTDKENALCHFTMTAHFVILSVATQRVARRSRSKKIHTFKMQIHTLIYGYFAALSMTR